MASDNQGTRSIQVSAKTVDEAIARALEQLGVARDDVEVEVLHAGSPGRLLGFGAEPARVRVTLTGTAGAATSAATEDVSEADEEEIEGDSQRARFGGAPVAVPPSLVGHAPRAEARAEEEEDERDDTARAGDAEMARIMLAELLNRMGLDEVHTEVVDTDPVTLNIAGGEVADLIGRRGENLRAVQFILNLMVNKQLHRHLRVVVDVDGYRARREDLLRNMAQRFAYRVRSTRESMQLEAMPPNERRIIHLALADDPDVMTESVGEGDARRVVIKPRR